METSAALARWLNEPRSSEVKSHLESADALVTSQLTTLEAERALVRRRAERRITDAQATSIHALLARESSAWTVVPIGDDILVAARGPFPREPVRSLDAIHLGTLLTLRTAVPDLGVLSLDDRVRENARLLGFTVVP